MSYKHLLYQKEEGIGIVTVNRPEVLNALNTEVFAELHSIFTEIENDTDVRVVILTGGGEKAFIAGADIADMQPRSSIDIIEFQSIGRKAADSIYNLSKPVIAVINGYALGGGCEIAMCCDLRIASEKARFGQLEINLAIIPGGGGTQRLTRLVGMTKAKELIYMGDIIDANTALSIGLINKVFPPESLMEEATQMAKKMVSKSGIALNYAKKAINSGADMGLPAALDFEEQCFALCFATEDQKEGMKAFLEKREASYKNR
ncbi:enoyl-CoA hydratase-related protein [Chloroflexota bacterium]